MIDEEAVDESLPEKDVSRLVSGSHLISECQFADSHEIRAYDAALKIPAVFALISFAGKR